MAIDPSPNIENMALYALCTETGKSFRARACKRQDCVKAIADELIGKPGDPHGPAKGHFEFPEKDELDFIYGWIYATEHEYIDPVTGNFDDTKLKTAIERHVKCPGDGTVHTMTG